MSHSHFLQFRYRRVSFIRWRRRSFRRPAAVVMPVLAVAEAGAPSTSAWRRAYGPAAVPQALTIARAVVLRIGEFIISEEGDPQLSGHPGIRY